MEKIFDPSRLHLWVLDLLRQHHLPPTTAWEWSNPYTHPQRMLWPPWKDTPHPEGHVPALLRGSRYLDREPPAPAIKAERFLARAAYVYRLTTPYRWEMNRAREDLNRDTINELVKSANKRFRRQRSAWGFFEAQDFRRYQDGKVVELDDEPHRKEEYELSTQMIQMPDFWARIEAARELLERAERFQLLEGKSNVSRRQSDDRDAERELLDREEARQEGR